MSLTPDLLCLSHLRWGFVFQRPNHLMTRCARGRRTFFWEEPIHDLGDDVSPFVETRQVDGGVMVATPHLRGGPGVDVAGDQRRLLDAWMNEHRIDAPILWFYTPMALAFAGHVEASAVVYDAMDELSNFHGAPPELRAREKELFEKADLVFTGGQSLYEAKKTQHPCVTAFPSSVDHAHFQTARSPTPTQPSDQAALPHPRIGFFGVIDERLDLSLLAQVADARPDWQLVMIGPVVKISRDSLPVRPNIHYLGQKAYTELPLYLAGWDIAMMPFALNDATRFISPTKTLEYLAAAIPVVSTPIHDVVHPYEDLGLVRIGADAASFVKHVESALGEPRDARRAAADAYLARTSWDKTWQTMEGLILDVLHAPEGRAQETGKHSMESAGGAA